ncbi:MAG: HAMP domain-containing protein [Betaproteobacteria bacterium]|nr:HAMP domain-containing protein [Betaproteobacteria bacterium]
MKKSENLTTRRHRSWLLGVALTILMSLAMVLMVLLTQATQQWDVYEQNFSLLFGLNAVFAVLLLLVITWFAWRLVQRLRQGKFGSRLLVKLAATFALVGILPGVLIYGVSYQFVTRSMAVWFDSKVEVALDAGLNLSRSTLDSLATELSAGVRHAASDIHKQSISTLPLALEKIRDQLDASEVSLWHGNGTLLASVGHDNYQLQADRPTPLEWRQVKTKGLSWRSEGLDDSLPGIVPRLKVLVQIPANGFQLDHQAQVIQAVKKLPPVLVANALAVLEANREYQERALARDGLQRMYIGTLTLALFLAVFGAVLLAVLLGNQLARPLLVLAEGVRDVAAGDLRPKPFLDGKDELDGLTRSFADMTQQLSDARSTVERSMAEVDLARNHLQTMLDNLTAGVILMDTLGHVLSVNPGATRILHMPLANHLGSVLQGVPGLAHFGQQVLDQFKEFTSEQQQHSIDHWQQSFELDASVQSDHQMDFGVNTHKHTTLVARGAVLPQGEWLLVFDDITEIISAQRNQAWAEVARRLAHEIKNPLTPIQLSAERLAMKLDGKLEPTEQALVTKSVKTIVDQVDALQRLVNEFRDFGRLPPARLQSLDLNALLSEMMPLYDNENAVVPVVWRMGKDLPQIMGDAAQLRQVVHNLIQNAQDACQLSSQPEVQVHTELRTQSQRVRLMIQDNGNGFSEAVLQRAFEPYVTTKISGTGLGLAVVKKIADDHHARIELKNKLQDEVVTGAQVSLSFRIADTQPNLN